MKKTKPSLSGLTDDDVALILALVRLNLDEHYSPQRDEASIVSLKQKMEREFIARGLRRLPNVRWDFMAEQR